MSAADPSDLEISPAELAGLLGAKPLLLDVRGADEMAAGMLEGAAQVEGDPVSGSAAARRARPGHPVIVYCATGKRSRLAAARLRTAGIPARSLAGGFEAWKAAGLPWVATAGGFSPGQLERYSRQVRLPEIGLPGQQRLRAARILCVGAGGLGSPAALYLAAAGVGQISLVDGDAVELSNLHRQVLHTTDRIGMAKVASARVTLEALNPEVQVITHAARLDAHNAAELLAGHHVVLDASDNFSTRYLINDVALALRLPVVHAAVQGFEGQVAVFAAGGRPCYRCLFPAPPPLELAPSCQEAGVLGVLPGLLGILQASEALKLVLGIGEPLVGRMLVLDALAMRFTELGLSADPGCRCAASGAGPGP